MQFEGWDVPIKAESYYNCRWSEILGIKPRRSNKTISDHVATARHLCQIHGAIPGNTWLIKHGYKALDQVLRRYPEYFVDFPRIPNPKPSLREQVLEAEKLAEDNGGILPNSRWLQTHKYKSIDNSIRRTPEAFSHLKQHVYNSAGKLIGLRVVGEKTITPLENPDAQLSAL